MGRDNSELRAYTRTVLFSFLFLFLFDDDVGGQALMLRLSHDSSNEGSSFFLSFLFFYSISYSHF